MRKHAVDVDFSQVISDENFPLLLLDPLFRHYQGGFYLSYYTEEISK